MRKLLIVGLIVLAIIVSGIYFANGVLRSRTVERAQSDLKTRAQVGADTLDRLLQSRMIEALTFAALPSMRGYAASEEPDRSARAPIALGELQSISAADPNIRAASILNEAGLVVMTTDGNMNADWSDRTFAGEALAGHLYASGPSRDFGEISQYYSAPILNNAGNVAGALVIRVSIQEMWGLLSSQPNVLVVDENGVCIGDTSSAPIIFSSLEPLSSDATDRLIEEKQYGADLVQVRAANLTELATAIKKGASRATYRDPKSGIRYAAIQQTETKDWTVVASEDESSIVQAAQEMTLLIVGIGVSAALLGAGASLLVAWKLKQERAN